MTRKLSAALAAMIALVDTGAEYPDAHWKIVCRHKLNESEADALQEAYDDSQATPAERQERAHDRREARDLCRAENGHPDA